MEKSAPLFVPLRAEHFRAFAAGTKTIEWRKFGKRFNDRTLWLKRPVTLSNGYSGDRLFGKIILLQFAPAEEVGPDALAIYKRRDLLVGIHIKLVSLKPQRPTRP